MVKKRYHLNPETLEISQCRAFIRRCPFLDSGVHYDSKEEAEKDLEDAFSSFIFRSKVKGKVASPEIISNFKLGSTPFERSSVHEPTFKSGEAEEWRELYHKLPDDVKLSIDYWWSNSENINKIMRREKDYFDGYISKEEMINLPDEDILTEYYLKKSIETLKSFINKSQTRRGRTYKGIALKNKTESLAILHFLKGLEKGSSFSFSSFVASSHSFDFAFGWVNTSFPLFFEIDNTKGAFLNSSVEEVLASPGSTYYYKDYEVIFNDITCGIIIRLEQK